MTDGKKQQKPLANYRLDEAVRKKIKELTESEHLTNNELFIEFIRAYEQMSFGNSAYGQGMQTDLENWANHVSALQQLYHTAVQNGVDAVDNAKKALENQLETAAQARMMMQEKLDQKDDQIKTLTANCADLTNEAKAACEEARHYKEDAENSKKIADKAEENATLLQEKVDSLKNELKESQKKADEYDAVKKELEAVKRALDLEKGKTMMQQQFIDKYLAPPNREEEDVEELKVAAPKKAKTTRMTKTTRASRTPKSTAKKSEPTTKPEQ